MKIKSVLDKLREQIIERTELVYNNISDITEYNLEEFAIKNGINNVFKTELNMTQPLDMSKSLISIFINFMYIKFGIKLDFEEYEIVKDKLARSLIEFLLVSRNRNLDITDLTTLITIEELYRREEDLFKIDNVYLTKELKLYVTEYYPEIERIETSILLNNYQLKTLLQNNKNTLIIPIKWYEIRPSVIGKKIIDDKTYLEVIVVTD